jgi:two-component system, NarL family, response regulator NreC
MRLKIHFVGNHELIGEGIKSMLVKSLPDVQLIESTGDSFFAELKKNNPNIVILDIDSKHVDGEACVRNIKTNLPATRILVLSMMLSESSLLTYLDMGVEGYILNQSSKEELIFAIEKLRNGGIYIGPEFTLNILTRNRLRNNSAHLAEKARAMLTDREMDVLELIAKGMTNAEMAAKLFISVRTIETRRKKILEKTGTTNTATLIKFAVLHGLIK